MRERAAEERRVRARGRVRAALRCPYCHDDVTRRGALACTRPGCGALYHRDCWAEAEQARGCAALGCGARTAVEVSAAGWALRLVRLVVVALLLPPRAAAWVRRRAPPAALSGADALRESVREQGPILLTLAVELPLVALLVAMTWSSRGPPSPEWLRGGVFGPLSLVVVVPFLLYLLGFVAWAALRAFAVGFARELGALDRADAPAGVTPAPPPPGKAC